MAKGKTMAETTNHETCINEGCERTANDGRHAKVWGGGHGLCTRCFFGVTHTIQPERGTDGEWGFVAPGDDEPGRAVQWQEIHTSLGVEFLWQIMDAHLAYLVDERATESTVRSISLGLEADVTVPPRVREVIATADREWESTLRRLKAEMSGLRSMIATIEDRIDSALADRPTTLPTPGVLARSTASTETLIAAVDAKRSEYSMLRATLADIPGVTRLDR